MKIIAANVSKDYNHHNALYRVSFSVSTGITALLGPNGAGKTTLLNILATLLTPTNGVVTIGGYDVQRQQREVREHLGFLPQDFGLYDGLTAQEFLDYMGLLKGLQKRRQYVQRALEQVGLEHEAKRRVGTYSGGMRQRLGIAQALLNNPNVVIVDEPTAGLDPAERIRFRQLLTQLAVERTVLLSTHLVEDVSLTASHVIVLDLGQIRFDGPLTKMMQSAQGKVWSIHLPPQEVDLLQQCYKVTSLIPTGSGFEVRFLSEDAPNVTATQTDPTVEDAYLQLVQ